MNNKPVSLYPLDLSGLKPQSQSEFDLRFVLHKRSQTSWMEAAAAPDLYALHPPRVSGGTRTFSQILQRAEV